MREGVETVVFLSALSFSSGSSIAGSALGITAALFLGFLIFSGSKKVNLNAFFLITSILLILFAAGFIAQSIHEFQEAALIPVFIEHLWSVNHLIDGKGTLGGILKGLFGYNGNPSLTEVIVYLLYIIATFSFWKRKL